MSMTPEITELLSTRNVILYGSALVMTVLVSVARVNRERAAQRREDKPLTTPAEMLWDVVWGSMAALCLLLIQDALKPLPIKLALAASMFYGYLGPSAWDLVASLRVGGLTFRKEGASDG